MTCLEILYCTNLPMNIEFQHCWETEWANIEYDFGTSDSDLNSAKKNWQLGNHSQSTSFSFCFWLQKIVPLGNNYVSFRAAQNGYIKIILGAELKSFLLTACILLCLIPELQTKIATEESAEKYKKELQNTESTEFCKNEKPLAWRSAHSGRFCLWAGAVKK